MKKIFILSVICCSFVNTKAQTTFKINIGGEDSAYNVRLKQAVNKDFIVTSEVAEGFTVSRINRNGTIKWSKFYKSNDSLNSLYVRSHTSTQDNGYAILVNDGVLKCDSTGKVQWAKKIVLTNFEYGFKTVCEAADSSLYIAASYNKFFRVIKISKNGALMWNVSYIYPIDELGGWVTTRAITSTKDSGVVIAFAIAGCYSYCQTAFLLKLNKTGALSWQRSIANSQVDNILPILLTNNQGEKVQMLYTDYFTDKLFYIEIEPSKTQSTVYKINRDIFSIQSFCRMRKIDEIKGKEIYYSLIYQPDAYIIDDDWSIIEANSFYYESDYDFNTLTKYDSLGRVCPNYTLPVFDKILSKSYYSIISNSYAQGSETIQLENHGITVTPYTDISVICRGSADLMSKTQYQQQTSSEIFKAYTNIGTQSISVLCKSSELTNNNYEVILYNSSGIAVIRKPLQPNVATTISMSGQLPGIYAAVLGRDGKIVAKQNVVWAR